MPFGKVVPFIGFDWDLDEKRVSLQDKKKAKYLEAVERWQRRTTHTLEDVQKLYGKLLHTCLIVPEGRAYLTKLEKMLAIFHDSPHKPRRPPRHTDADLTGGKGWFTESVNCENTRHLLDSVNCRETGSVNCKFA